MDNCAALIGFVHFHCICYGALHALMPWKSGYFVNQPWPRCMSYAVALEVGFMNVSSCHLLMSEMNIQHTPYSFIELLLIPIVKIVLAILPSLRYLQTPISILKY